MTDHGHMDHAEAHERIADLALEPGALAGALRGEARHDALAEHVATCERCQADVAAWRGVEATIQRSLQPGEPGARADIDPIEAGPEVRRRILASAGVEREPARARAGSMTFLRERRVPPALLGLAAALVVAIGGTFLLAGPATTLLQTVDQARELQAVVAAVDRVLADTDHATATLQTPAGQPAGTIAWSSRALVVLTSALAAPSPGHVYRCWLSTGNTETLVGRMDFAGGTAYWVGSLDEWASISLAPGTHFLVSLEPSDATSSAGRSGTVVLSASL